MDIKQLELLARMTDDNQHGQAREAIASSFSYLKHFEKLFKLVNKIHDLEGSIPSSVLDYRIALTRDMLKTIESHSGKQVAEQIKACI